MPKKRAGKEPLRGHDAWLAAKADIAKRNDAARDRLAKERSPHEKRRAKERVAQERREESNLPTQPGG
jgi:hypothetical protein